MRRMLLIGMAMVLCIGCARVPAPAAAPAPAVDPAPVAAPAQAAAPAPLAQTFPAALSSQPFWGEPGTRVIGDDGSELSYTYAPMRISGRTLYPVEAEFKITRFFTQTDGKLQVAAVHMPTGISNGLMRDPELVLALPYAAGAVWTNRRLVGFDQVETPAGTFPSLVLEEQDGSRQWWSPGTGLVKTLGQDHKVITAGRVEKTAPALVPYAARVTDTLTVLATNEGVFGPDGQLAEFRGIDGRRPSENWLDLGAGTPVVRHGLFSQGEPNWLDTYYAYQPATGRFEPVVWRFPDGTSRTTVAGRLNVDKSITFMDDERYPLTRYTVQWADGELKATVANEWHPDTEDRFVAAMARPLSHESWVSLFVDPKVGEQAYQFIYREGRNGLYWAKSGFGNDGAWEYRQVWGDTTVRFTVVRHGQDWRVATWEQK